MLLIVIKYGLENMLEYRTFNLNSPREWAIVKGSIDAFMKDEIKSKDGVTEFQTVVEPTASDLDNRRMPVFLGIKPTPDIKEIPVTLAIFNQGIDITI